MPQGTIKSYDPNTGEGSILDDAKTELRFERRSYEGMGMREFRLGQRVKFRLEGEGERMRVRDLTIVTF